MDLKTALSEARPKLTLKKANGDATTTRKRPAQPHDIVREFTFADGSRPIAIHKHAIAFLCPMKDAPDTTTLVAFRTNAKPVPIKARYSDVLSWWLTRTKPGQS